MCRRKLDEPASPAVKAAPLQFHNPSLGVNLHTKATRWILVVVILLALLEGLVSGLQGAYFTLIGLIPALISLAFLRGAVATARQHSLLVEPSSGTPSALGKMAAAFDFALKAGVVMALAGLALTFALCATCFFTFGVKGF
jgi:hypothetical protein